MAGGAVASRDEGHIEPGLRSLQYDVPEGVTGKYVKWAAAEEVLHKARTFEDG